MAQFSKDEAIAKGFTQAFTAECDEYVLDILVKADTDLDGSFKAYDVDSQEFLKINGWLWSMFEPA